MLTRRELMTGGAAGALSTAAAAPAAAAQTGGDVLTAKMLGEIDAELDGIGRTLDLAHRQNTLAFGTVPKIRDFFTQFVRANYKFPDYCEIGLNVFYDLYDWHVKNNQQIQITRQQENRLAIRFMFTLMVVRPEQDANYIGFPFDLR